MLVHEFAWFDYCSRAVAFCTPVKFLSPPPPSKSFWKKFSVIRADCFLELFMLFQKINMTGCRKQQSFRGPIMPFNGPSCCMWFSYRVEGLVLWAKIFAVYLSSNTKELNKFELVFYHFTHLSFQYFYFPRYNTGS